MHGNQYVAGLFLDVALIDREGQKHASKCETFTNIFLSILMSNCAFDSQHWKLLIWNNSNAPDENDNGFEMFNKLCKSYNFQVADRIIFLVLLPNNVEAQRDNAWLVWNHAITISWAY